MSHVSRRVLGVILMGGLSKRFGSPKGNMNIEGVYQWQRLEAMLDLSREAIVRTQEVSLILNIKFSLNTATRQYYPQIPEHQIVYDNEKLNADCPMNGLYSALSQYKMDCLLLAVDLFLLEQQTIERLLHEYVLLNDQAYESTFAVYYKNEKIQPLCAIYTQKLLPQITTAMYKRKFGLYRILESVPSRVIEATEEIDKRSFSHINSKDELARHYVSHTPLL